MKLSQRCGNCHTVYCSEQCYQADATRHEPICVERKPCKTCKLGCDIPAKFCSRCFSVFYCTVECQREDWPDHKKKCAKLLEAYRKKDDLPPLIDDIGGTVSDSSESDNDNDSGSDSGSGSGSNESSTTSSRCDKT